MTDTTDAKGKTPNQEATEASHSHKEEFKNPDALQVGMIDIWDWVEKNAKLLGALIAVLVLGQIAWTSVQYLHKRQERSAQEAFYSVQAKYAKLKEGFERARYESVMPNAAAKSKDAAADKKPSVATGDLQKDYGLVLSDLERVAKDQNGTSAGQEAALLAAQIYLEYKQPDRAAELARSAVDTSAEKSLLHQLASIELGNALATKGDCAGAVQVYQKVIDSKAAEFLQGDASLRSGVCFETLKQNDRAAEMYRKASATAQDSTAGQVAKGLLRALEVKTKSQTSAAPAAPAGPAAPAASNAKPAQAG